MRAPVVDHVLEGVGEVVLPLVRRGAQNVIDPLEQQLPVADVVQSDVGALGDRGRGLLDDPRHVPAGIGHDDAKALIIFDFFRPDDSIGLGRFDDREIGVEDRVDEDDEHRLVDVGPRQRHRPGPAVPSWTRCSMKSDRTGSASRAYSSTRSLR